MVNREEELSEQIKETKEFIKRLEEMNKREKPRREEEEKIDFKEMETKKTPLRKDVVGQAGEFVDDFIRDIL